MAAEGQDKSTQYRYDVVKVGHIIRSHDCDATAHSLHKDADTSLAMWEREGWQIRMNGDYTPDLQPIDGIAFCPKCRI